MEPTLISDEPNWVLKAVQQLEKNAMFKRIEAENGFTVLPIPTPDNHTLIGYANYDAPNPDIEEQKVNFPWVVFSANYPAYHFSYRATKPIHNPPTVQHYQPIFGKSEGFTDYYIRVHSETDHLENYYQLVSEVLAHHWLTGQPALPSAPDEARKTARAIAPFFNGAPENLRDFYIQEGKPFLDWLLQHL